jgi:hypothetical protein
MQTDDNDWNDETEIDTEVWLRTLLAISGDKERKAELIRKISEKTGQSPEQIEVILSATLTYLAGVSRSN